MCHKFVLQSIATPQMPINDLPVVELISFEKKRNCTEMNEDCSYHEEDTCMISSDRLAAHSKPHKLDCRWKLGAEQDEPQHWIVTSCKVPGRRKQILFATGNLGMGISY